MNKKTCLLQDWAIVCVPEPYKAPETLDTKLTGKVYGHPEFEDGTQITSSLIMNILDSETYETYNTIYKVGKKDTNYELYLQEYNSL